MKGPVDIIVDVKELRIKLNERRPQCYVLIPAQIALLELKLKHNLILPLGELAICF